MGLTPELKYIPAIRYGIDHEERARGDFISCHQVGHVGFKVEKCGLFVKPDRPYLACSPDGIVSCQCHGNALLEIKCPFVLRESSVYTEWSKTEFLEKKSEDICLKSSHKYFTQVQSQMGVTGISKTYFFVWTPKPPYLTQVINFDKSSWVANQEKLSHFFSGLLLPFLFGSKEIHICPKCELVCLDEKEILHECDCSVMCDCCNVWFHLTCAGLKSAPKEEFWLCPTCASVSEL